MKLIPLTRGLAAAVDDEDFHWLSEFKWHALSTGRGGFYAATGKSVLMHRMIGHKKFGSLEGKEIDHWGKNRLNNQRDNLRLVTLQQNRQNRSPRRGKTFKGISWSTLHNKWRADITHNKRHKFLGFFDTEKEAARAYDAAARKLFGEFASLNFPENNEQPARKMKE